ncbi:hypothetical protein PFISCL1PPCAC_15847, partial [Pristionchus fissidentatus]
MFLFYRNSVPAIWQLNQRQGGKSTVIHWPAGDYDTSIGEGAKMERYREFGNHAMWMNEIETIVKQLATDNLVVWYVSEPDHVLHGEGFHHNGEVKKTMAMLDELFGHLITEMGRKGYLKDIDIIFTADHGHIQVEHYKTLCVNVILKDLIASTQTNFGDCNIYSNNATFIKLAYEMLAEEINSKHLPYKLYRKKEIPDEWHYKHSSRTGDIVIEPLPGGQVKMKCPVNFDDSHTSSHGHDPNLKEMRALLVLSGPHFKEGEKFSEIPQNIDIFPLMTKLLNIDVSSAH